MRNGNFRRSTISFASFVSETNTFESGVRVTQSLSAATVIINHKSTVQNKNKTTKCKLPSEKNVSTLEQTERTAQKPAPVKKYDLSREKCGNTRGYGVYDENTEFPRDKFIY